MKKAEHKNLHEKFSIPLQPIPIQLLNSYSLHGSSNHHKKHDDSEKDKGKFFISQ